MKKIVWLLLTTVVVCNLYAQKPGNSVGNETQFQIIKLTVDFISKDHSLFPTPKSNCLKCNDYDCLIQFAKNGKLTKVDVLINRLQAKNIQSTEYESLKIFKDSVIYIITNGKDYRKTFPDYAKYINELDILVKNTKANDETSKTNANALKTEKVDTNDSSKVDEGVSNSSLNSDSETKDTIRDWVLYGIIALLATLIGILIYVVLKRNEIIAKLKEDKLDQKDNLKNQTITYNNKISSLETDLKNEREKVLELKSALQREKGKSQVFNTDSKINEPLQEAIFQQTQKQESPIKFARYADQGDGFSVSELLFDENNETIFQIKITGGTAKFRITNNRNAQKYALSNASYFFSKTCKYDTTPSMESIITTDVEGDLKLQGGKWQIQNPAKISFSL